MVQNCIEFDPFFKLMVQFPAVKNRKKDNDDKLHHIPCQTFRNKSEDWETRAKRKDCSKTVSGTR